MSTENKVTLQTVFQEVAANVYAQLGIGSPDNARDTVAAVFDKVKLALKA